MYSIVRNSSTGEAEAITGNEADIASAHAILDECKRRTYKSKVSGIASKAKVSKHRTYEFFRVVLELCPGIKVSTGKYRLYPSTIFYLEGLLSGAKTEPEPEEAPKVSAKCECANKGTGSAVPSPCTRVAALGAEFPALTAHEDNPGTKVTALVTSESIKTPGWVTSMLQILRDTAGNDEDVAITLVAEALTLRRTGEDNTNLVQVLNELLTTANA